MRETEINRLYRATKLLEIGARTSEIRRLIIGGELWGRRSADTSPCKREVAMTPPGVPASRGAANLSFQGRDRSGIAARAAGRATHHFVGAGALAGKRVF